MIDEKHCVIGLVTAYMSVRCKVLRGIKGMVSFCTQTLQGIQNASPVVLAPNGNESVATRK